jgi:hypothetical protein
MGNDVDILINTQIAKFLSDILLKCMMRIHRINFDDERTQESNVRFDGVTATKLRYTTSTYRHLYRGPARLIIPPSNLNSGARLAGIIRKVYQSVNNPGKNTKENR